MWYLFVLYWLTLLFFFTYKIKEKRVIIAIFVALTVLALSMQYIGLNYYVFSELDYEVKYLLGRFVEMIPYASIGIILKRLQEKTDKNKRFRFIIICIGLMGMAGYLLFYDILSAPGFGYSGIMKLIASTSAISLVSSICWYPSKTVKMWIRRITSHTFGIYCMHYIFGGLFLHYGLESGALLCVIVYVVCYFIALMMSKMPILLTLVD